MSVPAAKLQVPHARWGLEELPSAAVVIGAGTSRILAANALADDVFGTAPGGLVELGLATVLPNVGDLALRSAEPIPMRTEGRRRDGVPFPAEVRVRRTDARPASILCLVSRLDEADVIAHAAVQLEAAFDHAPIGMALFNCDGEYVRVNPALCAMLDRPEADLLGRRDQELTHPDDRAADVEVAWRILRGEFATHQTEKRFVRPDGSLVWTIANLSFLRDENGLPLAWLGQFQDISELRRTSHDLQRQASVDALTGCLNRRRGIEALDAAVEAARDADGSLGVLMIDLDHFKRTNDTFGHLAGDDVLRATAAAVAACLDEEHELVRYGGEEFMALLPAATPEAAMVVAERVRRSIARLDVRARGQRVRVSASVGVATLDPAADDSQSLVARADTGLYRAKAEGRNRVVAV